MCNHKNMYLLLSISVCIIFFTLTNSISVSRAASIAPENDSNNKQADILSPSFYVPERSIRAPINPRFGLRLSPFALKNFLASRLQNGDFGKRMGSEFLGKRSSMSDMSSLYDDPEAVAYFLEKKMGSEFLG